MDVPVFNTIADGQRAEALFNDPNIYGPFLVAVSLLLLQELIEPRLLRRWGRPLLALLTALVSIGWFLSYSRGAWLNFGVALAVFLVLLPLRRGGATRALVLVLVVIAGAGTTVATVVLTGQSDLPRGAGEVPELRHRALRRPAARHRAGRDAPDRHRAGAVRGRVAGVRALDLRPRGRRAGLRSASCSCSCCSWHAAGGDQQRRSGADTAGIGSLGLARGLVRDARELVRHRHAALAPPVAVRGPDLGRARSRRRRSLRCRREPACAAPCSTATPRRGRRRDAADGGGVEPVEHLARVEDRVQREAVEAGDEQHVVQCPRQARVSAMPRIGAESTST